MKKSANDAHEEEYDLHTYNSKNPLARFSHRSRYRRGLELFDTETSIKVLDYGCGDGRFLHNLKTIKNDSQLLGYEPYMQSKIFKNVSIFKHWSDILKNVKLKGHFDYVVCFEVLEHLNMENQNEIIEKAYEVLKKDGKFIVSVPIEKGVPSLVKNIRRILLHHDSNIYNLKNILASLFGKKTNWMIEHRKEDKYLSHIGFFYNELAIELKKKFDVEKQFFSPFKKMGMNFNSQIFYILKKREV